MNSFNKHFYLLAGVLSWVVMLSSCNKRDAIVLTQESTIYMPQALDTRGKLSLPPNVDTAQKIVFGAAYGGLKYPGQDITVNFKIDTNLIAAYNQANSTSYVPFPADSYTIPSLASVIKSGKTSSDPLFLSVVTSKLTLGTKYMLPITLTSISSGKLDSSLRTTYFTVDTLVRPEKDITGLTKLTVSKDNDNGAASNEGSSKLTDDDYNTKFLVFDFPSDFWMQLAFTTPQVLGAYTLTSGNDAPERDAKDWNLMGSNDGGVTWVLLDARTNQVFDGRNETVRYEFKNNTAYTLYRLYVTANNGDSIFQISEWRVIQYN